jgi:5-methylcytosine-specific restriction enzyme subunit McrC
MSTIPIQNVYYLLCYAWEQMQAGAIAETGAIEQTELVNLFAKVLINGTERVFKQGLDRGYVTQSEDTSRPRGRIDFGTSLKRALLPRAQAHCHFDVLSRDVLHNRILKSTLWHLAQAQNVDAKLRTRLLSLHRRFDAVSDVPLRRSLFQRIQLHSNNAFYRFLLHVCSLVERSLVPQEGGRGRTFQDFLRDEATMWKLFEKFVYHFYTHEQDVYEVGAPHIHWDVLGEAPERLPNMRTDVVLTSPDRTIIIDTKYSVSALTTRHEKDLYRSEHLYQLFAYLQNAETRGASFEQAEGMLLYPTTSVTVDDEPFDVRGHRMRIRTLDLSQHWTGIHDDLLQLVGCGERRR